MYDPKRLMYSKIGDKLHIFFFIMIGLGLVFIFLAFCDVFPMGKRKSEKPKFALGISTFLAGVIIELISINKLLIYYDKTSVDLVNKPIGIIFAVVILAAGVSEVIDYRKLTIGNVEKIVGKIVSVEVLHGLVSDKYLPIVEYVIEDKKNRYIQNVYSSFRYYEGDEYTLNYNSKTSKIYSDLDCSEKKDNAISMIVFSLLLAGCIIFFI